MNSFCLETRDTNIFLTVNTLEVLFLTCSLQMWQGTLCRIVDMIDTSHHLRVACITPLKPNNISTKSFLSKFVKIKGSVPVDGSPSQPQVGPSKINVFPRSLLWLSSVFLAEQSHSSWDILPHGSREDWSRVKTVSWLAVYQAQLLRLPGGRPGWMRVERWRIGMKK